MGNLTINNGGIITNSTNLPNVDLRYGPYRNGRGSSNADCIRGSSGSTQDGFNVYVLDMENKRVGIARIGSNMTVNLEPRTACWISFADSPIQ